jgi:hypothetical protein
MTKRHLCAACCRPLKTCICKHIQSVTNLVPLIILQHPQEVNEAILRLVKDLAWAFFRRDKIKAITIFYFTLLRPKKNRWG